MTAIHLDAVGGIAGDMFVAAMLDALPDLKATVLADAAAALPAGVGSPELVETTSGGLRALRFGLSGRDELAERGDAHSDHHHAGDGHRDERVLARNKDGSRTGGFRDMASRIRSASLSPGAADQAVAILTLIAEADSLVDVVAAGSIAAALSRARWTVSALPLGGGLVSAQHGLLPVPAPATVALLTGFDWRDDGVGGERVTPTGAAILKRLVGRPRETRASGRIKAAGYGA